MPSEKAQRRAAKATARQEKANRAAARDQMPADVPIFWVEPTGQISYRAGWKCPNDHYQDREVAAFTTDQPPIACDQCDAQARCWSASQETEYRRPDTGETWRRTRDLPPGACYEHPKHDGEYRNWISEKGGIISRAGRDGRVLCVVLPDGQPWTIDSRANNCTLPNDDKHWCWVREGRPEDGTLNVSKAGRTCSAGAGSIATSRYHGFLRHGHLVRC